MEVLQRDTLNKIIDQSLSKSYTYNGYRDLIDNLASNNGTTGTSDDPYLIEYTKLNARRLRRWEKTLKLDESQLITFQKVNRPMDWIVITESWCGDAAHMMPVFKKVADHIPELNLRVVLRDEHDTLMDQFLTDGSRSIPKLIGRDRTSKELLFSYGPRPFAATKMVAEYKSRHGSLSEAFKEDLQRWYNKDKGQSAVKDLIGLLK